MKRFGTIYKITNKINGKAYVGLTIQKPLKRFQAHCWGKGGRSEIMPIRMVIKKYKKENFIFEEIVSAFSKESLIYYEQFFIQKFNTLSPNGYNLTKGGDGTTGITLEQSKSIGLRNRIRCAVPVIAKNVIDGTEKRYQCMSDVKKDGFSQPSVHKICNHKGYTYKDHTFRYENGEYPNILLKKKGGRSSKGTINAQHIETKKIIKFKNILDVENLGFSYHQVYKRIVSGKIYKNYIWWRE